MNNIENGGGLRKDLSTDTTLAVPLPSLNMLIDPPPQYASLHTSYTHDIMVSPLHTNYNIGTASLPQTSYNHHFGEAPLHSTVYCSNQNTGRVSGVGSRDFTFYSEKSLVETYLLAISPFGLLGAHHFYLNRYYWGITYFFTAGLLGCGYLIDWFRIPCLVKQANNKIKNPGKDLYTIHDAYTMWFPMGLLGFHHYYLRNYFWGVVYTCTLGMFGIGWIIDVFRMPALVRSANEKLYRTDAEEKSVCLAVTLGVSPFGILGAHHYYLNNPVWGFVYTFTGGLAGFGWLADWFRMPTLINRANKVSSGDRSSNVKTIDDAYVLWFPFGILGFHHFYLRRPIWGMLYFFTAGIGGLGWLIDMCRIPRLVKEANLEIEAEQERLGLCVSRSAGQNKGMPTVSVATAPYVQGYPNNRIEHQVVGPSPSWPHPSMGAYGYAYQRGGYEDPHINQREPPHNFVHSPGAYNLPSSAHNEIPPTVDNLPPPPYHSIETN